MLATVASARGLFEASSPPVLRKNGSSTRFSELFGLLQLLDCFGSVSSWSGLISWGRSRKFSGSGRTLLGIYAGIIFCFMAFARLFSWASLSIGSCGALSAKPSQSRAEAKLEPSQSRKAKATKPKPQSFKSSSTCPSTGKATQTPHAMTVKNQSHKNQNQKLHASKAEQCACQCEKHMKCCNMVYPMAVLDFPNQSKTTHTFCKKYSEVLGSLGAGPKMGQIKEGAEKKER